MRRQPLSVTYICVSPSFEMGFDSGQRGVLSKQTLYSAVGFSTSSQIREVKFSGRFTVVGNTKRRVNPEKRIQKEISLFISGCKCSVSLCVKAQGIIILNVVVVYGTVGAEVLRISIG